MMFKRTILVMLIVIAAFAITMALAACGEEYVNPPPRHIPEWASCDDPRYEEHPDCLYGPPQEY